MEARILPKPNNEKVPASPFPYHHYMRIQMRFNDFDMFGHMNNMSIMSFLDLGKVHYFQHVFGREMDPTEAAVVVANTNCTFVAPIMPPNRVEVYTTCLKVGTRSLTLEQRLVDMETRQPYTICTTTLVGFDPATNKSADIRPDFIDLLSAYEHRNVRTAANS